ncbi:hypothetical protein ACFPT7_16865 [Acidicapsa dinghuensis]|uniref:Secreted protein n=1 Tax=Acidicapsa dinghuensis TaxID=2218256 RepID=A0ABW1EJ15_9BACT|nr:hypothetical protein [Acidicapsa dinghuensis]
MKRFTWLIAITFSASLASNPVAAQSTSAAQQPDKLAPQPMNLTVWNTPSDQASGCPVSMHASQIGGGTTVTVDNDGHRHSISRGLHLSLTDPLHSANIVSANLTVHGLNGKPHTVQSGSVFQFNGAGKSNPWEITRNLTVQFGPTTSALSNDHSAETELSTAGFASVTWIRLDSLTLSDGTIWVPNSAVACRAVPDPFMLVNAK